MEKINGNLNTPHYEPEELKALIGSTVKIHGVIYKIRVMKGFAFVILRSDRYMIQCVHSRDFSQFDLSELKENMNVVLTGEVFADLRSRTGAEVRLLSFTKLSEAYCELPVVINNKELNLSLDTLLDHRTLTLRNEKERAVFKLQEGLARGFRRFFEENRFTEIHTPKIVYAGAEGGANIFSLPYFGNMAYLTQSPQFYKQIMVGVFERVYEIGPVFRAEKHDTSRHTNEYTSVDMEMGFIENYYDIMHMETKMLQQTFKFIKENYSNELTLLQVTLPEAKEIPVIPFYSAKELISKTYSRKIKDYKDFEPEEERLLSEIVLKETGCEFVFVTEYPSEKRPFYAMDKEDDVSVTASFDLIFRGMEITTGGQRIHDYNQQIEKIRSRGMDEGKFESYLSAHKYGLPPHGGFGLGLERLTMKLAGFNNIRRSTLFPRDTKRLEP